MSPFLTYGCGGWKPASLAMPLPVHCVAHKTHSLCWARGAREWLSGPTVDAAAASVWASAHVAAWPGRTCKAAPSEYFSIPKHRFTDNQRTSRSEAQFRAG